jgi:TIR domain
MKVFLSHSSNEEENRDLIQKITDELTRAGMEVWDDTREIYPSDNWAQVTSQALEESQAMVVLLTPESIDSKWIKWSIGFALGNIAYKRRLVPVLVGDPNRFAQDNLPYPWIFRNLRVINLPDHGKNDENIKQIAEVIKAAA